MSFLDLLVTKRAGLFWEFFPKMPSIYLITLVSLKCKYRSHNSQIFRLGGVQICLLYRAWGASRKQTKNFNVIKL